MNWFRPSPARLSKAEVDQELRAIRDRPARRRAAVHVDAGAMIVLDTSILVDSLTGQGRSDSPERLRRRHRPKNETASLVPALVLYEWLRGPRRIGELAAQEALFPRESALRLWSRKRQLKQRPSCIAGSQDRVDGTLDSGHRRLTSV